MKALDRWKERRLEDAHDRVTDARSEVAKWELFERNHGGFKHQIRRAQRRLARVEKRLALMEAPND